MIVEDLKVGMKFRHRWDYTHIVYSIGEIRYAKDNFLAMKKAKYIRLDPHIGDKPLIYSIVYFTKLVNAKHYLSC